MYNIHRLQDIQYKDNKKDQGGDYKEFLKIGE